MPQAEIASKWVERILSYVGLCPHAKMNSEVQLVASVQGGRKERTKGDLLKCNFGTGKIHAHLAR